MLYSLPSDSPGFTDSFQLEPIVKACVNITCRSSSTLKSLIILQVWDLFPVWDLHYRFLKVLQVFSGAEATWKISYLPVLKFVSSESSPLGLRLPQASTTGLGLSLQFWNLRTRFSGFYRHIQGQNQHNKPASTSSEDAGLHNRNIIIRF